MGERLPDGAAEKFDKDCSSSVVLRDWLNATPQPTENLDFTYADTDINEVSARLGIWWEPSKLTPFQTKVPYLSFCWDLCHMHGPPAGQEKGQIPEHHYRMGGVHAQLDTQKLYGKLLHAMLAGHPCRASLPRQFGGHACLIQHGVFILHTPPWHTPLDLPW